MDITYSSFLAVVGSLLGPAEAYPSALFEVRLNEALKAITGRDQDEQRGPAYAERLSPAAVGQLLALALRPDTVRANAPFQTPLANVTLYCDGRNTDLTPAEAARHPVLRDWVAGELGASFANLFAATQDFSILSAAAPATVRWNLSDEDGDVSAWLMLTFQARGGAELSAVATYGAERTHKAINTAREIDGGRLLQALNYATELNEDAPEGSSIQADRAAVAAAEAEEATVH